MSKDILAGYPTQIRKLKKRIKELNMEDADPSKVESAINSLRQLEDLYKEEKERKEERRKARQERLEKENLEKESDEAPEPAIPPAPETEEEVGEPDNGVTELSFKDVFNEVKKETADDRQAIEQALSLFTGGVFDSLEGPKREEFIDMALDKVKEQPTDVELAPTEVDADPMEKESTVDKYALDDVVEPSRGTPGSRGRVMRYDANQDLAYVHWDEGKLAERDGFGCYKGSDLKNLTQNEKTSDYTTKDGDKVRYWVWNDDDMLSVSIDVGEDNVTKPGYVWWYDAIGQHGEGEPGDNLTDRMREITFEEAKKHPQWEMIHPSYRSVENEPVEKESESPPGWEKTVEDMKDHKEIDNPFALSWWMKNKGYEPEKKSYLDRQAEMKHEQTITANRFEKLYKKADDDMTVCDACGQPLSRRDAIKSPRGQGTYDYFCDELCQQDFLDRGETYLDASKKKALKKTSEWAVEYYPNESDKLHIEKGFQSKEEADKWIKSENINDRGTDISVYQVKTADFLPGEREMRKEREERFQKKKKDLGLSQEDDDGDVDKEGAANNAVVEAFIERTNPKTKSGNLYILPKEDGWELVNYRTVIAKHLGDKIALDNRRFSVSTTKIQRYIQNMAESAGIPLVDLHSGKPLEESREDADFHKMDPGTKYDKLTPEETTPEELPMAAKLSAFDPMEDPAMGYGGNRPGVNVHPKKADEEICEECEMVKEDCECSEIVGSTEWMKRVLNDMENYYMMTKITPDQDEIIGFIRDVAEDEAMGLEITDEQVQKWLDEYHNSTTASKKTAQETVELDIANRKWKAMYAPNADGWAIFDDNNQQVMVIKSEEPLNKVQLEQIVFNELGNKDLVRATLARDLAVLKKGSKVKPLAFDARRREMRFVSADDKNIRGWTSMDKFAFEFVKKTANDRSEFIQYLRNRLIPDLRESGMNATADDFVTLIKSMGPNPDHEFLDYLRHTLIPDLRESGKDATADDFETGLSFIKANKQAGPIYCKDPDCKRKATIRRPDGNWCEKHAPENKKESSKTFKCRHCGGEVPEWKGEEWNRKPYLDGDVCLDCAKKIWPKKDSSKKTAYKDDAEMEQLWESLTDVPFDGIDENGELEPGVDDTYLAQDWHIFPKGTPREDIWHWFDANYSKGLAALMGYTDDVRKKEDPMTPLEGSKVKDGSIRIKSLKLLTDLSRKCPDCFEKFAKFTEGKKLSIKADDITETITNIREKIQQTKERLQESIQTEAASDHGFQKGDRVTHPDKGEGTITYVSPEQITVDWDWIGDKILGPQPIPKSKKTLLKDIKKIDSSEKEAATPPGPAPTEDPGPNMTWHWDGNAWVKKQKDGGGSAGDIGTGFAGGTSY